MKIEADASCRPYSYYHFDAALSSADVDLAARVYGQPMPELAYLPCGGTLRHALPLLERGVGRLVAVDLSLPSLAAGLAWNVPAPARHRLSVHHADIRLGGDYLPASGVKFVFLGGNSLGEVTDPNGHVMFIAALAAVLAPGGVLVFDYVGDRYLPSAQGAVTEWPDIYPGAGGGSGVIDRRTRKAIPVPGTAMSVLSFTSEVRDARTGAPVAQAGSRYDKLVVPDALLVEQFAAAGLDLANVGGVPDLSPYHRDRIRRSGDLGMLGEPACVYRAVKM